VEDGWGARSIDPETWKPHETFDGPSLWGHDRLYMDKENRKRLRDMGLDAAARGVRAPFGRGMSLARFSRSSRIAATPFALRRALAS